MFPRFLDRHPLTLALAFVSVYPPVVAVLIRKIVPLDSAAALKILDEVRGLGLQVTEILYNTAMEACAAAGQTKLSLSLLEVSRLFLFLYFLSCVFSFDGAIRLL